MPSARAGTASTACPTVAEAPALGPALGNGAGAEPAATLSATVYFAAITASASLCPRVDLK